MKYARAAIATPITVVDAASGADPKICPKFMAYVRLIESIGSEDPTSGNLRQTVQQIPVFNYLEEILMPGDDLLCVQLIDEIWVAECRYDE